MKKQTNFPDPKRVKKILANKIPLKDAYAKHVEELFEEICEIFTDAEARAIFASVLLKPRIDKRSLKAFNWRDFKPTDYVSRESDDPQIIAGMKIRRFPCKWF